MNAMSKEPLQFLAKEFYFIVFVSKKQYFNFT